MNEKTKEREPRSTEKRIYEILGIRSFRKLVLRLERYKHRNDGGKNVNYHLHGSGIRSVRRFTGYLLYNAACHCISLFFVALYFAITRIAGIRYAILDVFILLLFFLNVYCILLQRYIYIQARRTAARRTRARNDRMAAAIERLTRRIEQSAYPERTEEYSLVERLYNSIHGGADCVIGESDLPALRRISESVRGLFEAPLDFPKMNGKEEPLAALLLRMPERPFLIDRVTRQAAALQRLFHARQSDDLLFGSCVITQNKNCENAYRALIQSASFDAAAFVFDVLFAAYRNTLLPAERTRV